MKSGVCLVPEKITRQTPSTKRTVEFAVTRRRHSQALRLDSTTLLCRPKLDFDPYWLSLVFGTMLKQAYHKLCAHGSDKIRLALYSQTRGIHCGQPSLGPRSFFGVEDYLDDDNSRPYTYQKEKKSKNTDKHVSFKQRTIAYMEPFTLDVFISKRFVSASFTHRVTSKQVAVAGTNSKDIKAALKSRSDIPACLAVGRILAERAREADVYTASYTPRERDKFEGKIRAVVQSLIDNGIDVKVYLD
ncbi:unnamed protein product [Camellia sinensis]